LAEAEEKARIIEPEPRDAVEALLRDLAVLIPIVGDFICLAEMYESFRTGRRLHGALYLLCGAPGPHIPPHMLVYLLLRRGEAGRGG
jgi:hypothetical protein